VKMTTATITSGELNPLIAGVCKLCHQMKPLRKSHFMPAALYPKHIRKKVQFAQRGRVTDSGQEMATPALCNDCEQLLDRQGESEVLRAIAPKATKSYPLHDRLRLAVPRDDFGGAARFAGYDVGLDMNKFAYFALSIVWKRAAIDWPSFDGTMLPRTPLDDFEEQIRQYLLGNTGLPPDIVVIVVVSSDEQSRKVWYLPEPEVMDGCLNFRFVVRGVFFRVLIGYGMPPAFRDICCTSPRKCLFYGDGGRRAPEIMRIFQTAQDNEN
jgi:hypothetical protein